MENLTYGVRFIEIHRLISQGMQEASKFAYEECKKAPKSIDGRPKLTVR